MKLKYPLAQTFVVSAALTALSAGAVDRDASRGQVISEVVVKGQLIDSRRSAYSASTFSADHIGDLNISHTQALFDQVPGMSIRKLGLAGVADNIVIRGFGGGGHGGDLGAVIDGIPLNEAMSHADGYVDFGVLVPLEIDSLTVYKGPVSALYGNYNRGGLVRVDTRKSGDYTALDLAAGSYGLADLQAAWGAPLGSSQQVNVAAQHFRSDGYRPQSDSEYSTLAGRWGVRLSNGADLAISGRWHEADSDSPSYLTLDQYQQRPYGMDARAQNDGSDKQFATLRLDLNHDLNEDLRLLSFAYTTRQDFTRWFSRPVGGGVWRQREESYDREVSGAGVNLNGLSGLADTPITWVVGIEGFRESTEFECFDGLDNRQRNTPAIDDRKTRLASAAAFAEMQAELHPLFTPSLGARYDRFSGNCRLQGPETGANPCNSLNALDNLSPKLGFRSQVHDTLQLRVSWAEGFALPNGWVKYQAEATNLDPVIFRQKELGLTWQPTAQLELDIAAYQLKSSGEVRTVAPGVFENYGATERTGVETTLSWAALNSLSLFAVYGVADSKVVRAENPAISGNEVGGVPDYSGTLRAQLRITPVLEADLKWRLVGDYALSVDNAEYSDSYDTVDLGLSLRPTQLQGWKFYLRAENVTDKRYAPAQLRIGGEGLVSVGTPRQFRVGAQLNL